MAAPRVLIENLPEQPVPEPADLLVVQNGAITKKMLVGALTTLTSAPIDEHITDDAGAHAASSISAQPNAAPMTGTDVQTQLSQIAAELIAVRESEHIEVGPIPPSDTEWLWADTNEGGSGTSPSPPLYFNVMDFGAVGDGVADDTAAIQAAIDSVGLGAGVPAVSIAMPPGTYKITTSLIIHRRGVRLLGAGVGNPADLSNPGQGTTLKWGGPGGIPMIYVQDASHVRIADIYFSGRAAPNQPSEGIFYEAVAGDSVGTNSHPVLERCWFGWWYGLAPAEGDWVMDYCVRWGGANENNDQFVISNCQFYSALIAAVKIDQTQSVWGTFYDCVFGWTVGDVGHTGFVTSSSTTLVNPQFDGCELCIEIKSSANVNILGLQAERFHKLANINMTSPDHMGRLLIRGGFVLLHENVGPYYIEHLGASAGGGLDIDGLRINTGGISPRPKIKVRGVDGAPLAGFVSLRNAGAPVADLDVVAPAINPGIHVQVDDYGVFDRKYVTDGATYVPSTYEARLVADYGFLASIPSAYLNPTVGTVTTPDPGSLPNELILVYKVTGPVGEGTIAGQFEAAPHSWFINRLGSNGNLFWHTSPDGGAGTATAAAVIGPVPTGQIEELAVAVTQNTGSMTVWRRTTVWQQINTQANASRVAFETTQPVRIGMLGAAPGAYDWQGRIYSVELRTGLYPAAGTVLWRFDAAEYPGTGTSYVDPRGRTWTLTSAAAIVRP